MSHFLFLNASTREPGHVGNSETLARHAAAALPAEAGQSWLKLAELNIPPFVDLRHTTGSYPMPEGDVKALLDATLAATDLVFVSPVYWFSIPSPLKTCLDHWSAWAARPRSRLQAAHGRQAAVGHRDQRQSRKGPADARQLPPVRRVSRSAMANAALGQGRSTGYGARRRRCDGMPHNTTSRLPEAS